MSARIHAASREREQGFTLIELLVVIIIIGLLAAIAIPVFLDQRKKAIDASLKSDVKSVASAQEAWLVDNPSFPGTVVPAQIVAAGFKKTPGNTVMITTNSTKNGYCILGSNPRSSAKPPRYFMYDSVGGGFLVEGKPFLYSVAPPGAQACDWPGLGAWVWL